MQKLSLLIVSQYFYLLLIVLSLIKLAPRYPITQYTDTQGNSVDPESVTTFFRIPSTNVVLVVAQYSVKQNSSIVYYTDMVTGETLSVIYTDYSIKQIEYIQTTEKIIVLTGDGLIIADPYTFVSSKKYSIPDINHIAVIQYTNFVVITFKINFIDIFDVMAGVLIKRLVNTQQSITQYYTKQVTLTYGEVVLITCDQNGLQLWTIIQMPVIDFKYEGFLDTKIYSQDTIRAFDKLIDKDVFLIGGESLQIKAIALIPGPTKQFIPILNINVNNESVASNKINDVAVRFVGNAQKLFVGNKQKIYIMDIQFDQNNQLILNNYIQPTTIEQQSLYNWYNDIYSPYILMINSQVQKQVVFYNTISNSVSYGVQFLNSGNQRRIKFLKNGVLETYVILNGQILEIFEREMVGFILKKQKPAYSMQVKPGNSSFFKVLGNDNYVFILAGDNTNDYIIVDSLDDSTPIVINITQLYNIKWDNIQNNLTPFFYNNAVWVALGFKSNLSSLGCFLMLINTSTPTMFQLKTDPETYDGTSSQAFVSLVDVNNLEVIGLDSNGGVFRWNLVSRNFIQKLKINSCASTTYADIFHFQLLKFLISQCDQNKLVSLNLQSSETKIILQDSPLISLRKTILMNGLLIFNDLVGVFQIYQFNPSILNYNFLTKITTKSLDNLVAIDIVNNGAIWLQYVFSNYHYSINDCFVDPKFCQCNLQYFFVALFPPAYFGSYGLGIPQSPFISPQSIIIPIIKSQQCFDLNYFTDNAISSNLQLTVIPPQPVNFRTELINSIYSPNIQLTINSADQNQYAQIMAIGNIVFVNYKYLKVQNIRIIFNLNMAPVCQMVFEKVQNVEIDNIQLDKTVVAAPTTCKMLVKESQLKILKYNLENQDLYEPLIVLLTPQDISINNFTLNNCKLNYGFNILVMAYDNSISQNLLQINGLTITNNQDIELPTAKFATFLIMPQVLEVKNVYIHQNSFILRTIFADYFVNAPSKTEMIFDNIVFTNNLITNPWMYIILYYSNKQSINDGYLYKMNFKNMVFAENNLARNPGIRQAFFVLTSMRSIDFYNATLVDHSELQIVTVQVAKFLTFNTIECYNTEKTPPPIKPTGGCIAAYEAENVTIKKIKMHDIIQRDWFLIYLEYIFVTVGKVDISELEIYNIQSHQVLPDFYTNLIMMNGRYFVNFTISDSKFQNNDLKVIKDSVTYSANGLYVDNPQGVIQIKNTQFLSSQSNSKYNTIYFNIQQLTLDNVTFEGSSFVTKEINTQPVLFQQIGGFLNLKLSNLIILNSHFSKSTAKIGAFIYVTPKGSVLQVTIVDTTFSEGYAFNGGAIYMGLLESRVFMQSIRCKFVNIFSSSGEIPSAIAIDQQPRALEADYNDIKFIGGSITNIYGNANNYFLKLVSSNLLLEGIQQINQDNSSNSLNSEAHNYFTSNAIQKQSTLLGLTSSILTFNNCLISNFLNFISDQAQFITSNLSKINLNYLIIRDGLFKASGVKIEGGYLKIVKSQFLNMKNSNLKRLLLTSSGLETQISSSQAFFIVNNSDLSISDNTQFVGIKCYKTCYGSALQLSNTKIDIQSLTILQSQATYGGGILIKGLQGKNQIKSLLAQDNKSEVDGGSIYLQLNQNDVIQIQLSKSKIISTLFYQAFQLDIQDSNLLSNEALNGKGGALVILSDQDQNISKQIINFIDTKVKQNQAQAAGGIYYENVSPQLVGATEIEANIGKVYGNDLIPQPTQLILQNSAEIIKLYPGSKVGKNYLLIEDFRSGAKIQELHYQLSTDNNLFIKPINSNEQSTFDLKMSISSTQNNIDAYELKGNSDILYNQQTNSFQFSNLIIIGKPETTLTLEVRSDQVMAYDNVADQFEKDYFFKIVIRFRNCLHGEVVRVTDQQIECAICDEGTYTFDTNLCKLCPEGATCLGGSQLEVHAEYWRKTELSDQVVKCDNLVDNCIGGGFGNSLCFDGHIGALCEECDLKGEYWPESYSKSSAYSCVKCSQIKYNSWIVGVMVIWTLISMSLAIKGGVDQIKEKAAIQILKKTFNRRRQTTVQGLENSKQLVSQKLNNSKGFPSQKNVLNKSIDINNSINNFKKNQSINNLVNDDNINEITNEEKSSVFVKMLTNYIQIVSSVATFNLSIPSGVFDFPQAAGQPLKQTMNSLDCALIEMNSNIPIIYLRFLFSLGLPISYLLLFLIGHYVYHLAKKSKIQWYILSTAAMFLIIYVQPDLVQQMISLMSCRRIGETDFILSNVSYECYTDEHKKYIAFLLAPFLIVWVFILPGILLIVLRNRKNILNDSSVQLKFGFLYKEYTNEAYYWEFVKMAEKIIIILCLNFYSQDVPVKATLVFIVITIYGVLSLIFKPYQEEEINQIDFYSTKVCAITVLLALFIYKNPFIYLQYLSLIIIIALNVWFLIKILKSLINVFWIKLSPMFQSILETLASKIPCLKKYAKKNKKVKPEVRERFRKIFKAFQNQPEEIKRKIVEKIQESYQKNKEIQQENKGIQQENKGNNKEEEKQLSTIKEKLSIGSLKEYPNPERNKDSCIVDSDMNSLQANKVKVLDKPIRTEIAINEEIIIFSDDNLVLQKSCESQRSKTENGLIEAPQIQLEMQNSNGIQQTFGQNG